MPKSRISSARKVRPRILILCEGEKTEPYYFKGLKSDPAHANLTSVMVISNTKFNTARELINQAIIEKKIAIREENPYLEIWVVIDKDGYTKHPESFDLARTHQINIAFSSISFEYWILLHFIYTSKSFSKDIAAMSYIKKNTPLTNYEKKYPVYNEIKHRTADAIENARQLRKLNPDLEDDKCPIKLNPYTNVDTLVYRLIHIDELIDAGNKPIRIPHTNWNFSFPALS